MKKLFALLLPLLACHRNVPAATQEPFAEYHYATTDDVANTKVFLVAGGDDVANFAAEVLEQRTLWRRAGLREDEIACYWAAPTPEALRKDAEQYRALALALRSCRAATAEQLLADMNTAATHAQDFVYVFVSSHGLASQLTPLESSTHPRTQRFVASLSAQEKAVLEPAAIGLSAGDGPKLGEPRGLVAALRTGSPPESLAFTPRTVGAVLAAFPSSVKKVLVLQACFSGGFIDHHADRAAPPSAGADALLAVPNLTVLTATAAERPSFGCGSGESRTYFGGAFNVALEQAMDEHPASDMPWRDIYDRVAFAIEAMEAVQGQRASHPGFVETPSSL